VPPAEIATALDRLAAACAAGKIFHIALVGDRLGFSFAGSAATQGFLPMTLPDDAAATAHGKIAATLASRGRAAPRAPIGGAGFRRGVSRSTTG